MWRRVFFFASVQNHDIPMRTNAQLVKIFTLMNGTNDISALAVPWERVNAAANWTFDALRLFVDEERNLQPHRGFAPMLQLAKSFVEVSASREMIEFVMNELDVRRLMQTIEQGGKIYGVDEVSFSVLFLCNTNTKRRSVFCSSGWER